MTAPADARQARETWMRYDTFRISSRIATPSAVNGASSFANLATFPSISFFNARTRTEVGQEYTNVEDKGGVEYPIYVESVGIRFVCPSPLLTDLTPNGGCMSKMFQDELPEHCSCEFMIGQDTKLILKPFMMPPGYGPMGSAAYTQWLNQSFVAIENSGSPVLGNRFQQIEDMIAVPAKTPIELKVNFGPEALFLLNRMTLWDFDLFEGEDASGEDTTPAMCKIEASIRGVRLVQQRGELFAS